MEFRKLVWEYHGAKESAKIPDLYGYLSAPAGRKNSPIPALKKQAEDRIPELKKLVEEHPCFAHVKKPLQGQIKKGLTNLVLYDGAILARFKIPKFLYDAPYTNLSQFVHASAFSLDQLPKLNSPSPVAEAQFHLVYIFVNFLFATALGEAIRAFGGTKSLNDKITLILNRNRAVLEHGYQRASEGN